jgi:hypothetical protein
VGGDSPVQDKIARFFAVAADNSLDLPVGWDKFSINYGCCPDVDSEVLVKNAWIRGH